MFTKATLGTIEAIGGKIVGETPEIQKICGIIQIAARTNHPVLIMGEPGTGKEVIARAIHSTSLRRHMAFVRLDCANLQAGELEPQLLNFRAQERSVLNFDRGTLFLDRISELNFELQASLLRALEQAESSRYLLNTYPQARILAASTRDLQLMVEEGSFRRDLYFRLNALTLRVPPLRERRSDIPLLALSFLSQLSHDCRRPYELSPEAMRALIRHDWPGNVRELEASLKLSCSSARRPLIGLSDLPQELQHGKRNDTAGGIALRKTDARRTRSVTGRATAGTRRKPAVNNRRTLAILSAEKGEKK